MMWGRIAYYFSTKPCACLFLVQLLLPADELVTSLLVDPEFCQRTELQRDATVVRRKEFRGGFVVDSGICPSVILTFCGC